MRVTIQSVKLLLECDNGNKVEVEMSPDGKEFLSVKPLFQPIGLIFYLNRHPLLEAYE